MLSVLMERRGVSAEELAAHCTTESLWVAVNGLVYDLTSFVDEV